MRRPPVPANLPAEVECRMIDNMREMVAFDELEATYQMRYDTVGSDGVELGCDFRIYEEFITPMAIEGARTACWSVFRRHEVKVLKPLGWQGYAMAGR